MHQKNDHMSMAIIGGGTPTWMFRSGVSANSAPNASDVRPKSA
jgi:hypothetical protein